MLNLLYSRRSLYLNLAKLFYLLFLVYYGWFQSVFFQVPAMTPLLGSLMIIFIIFHILERKYLVLKVVNFELIIWSIFMLVFLVVGLIVAENKSYMLDAIFTFAQYLAMILSMIYISIYDRKITLFINIFILFSLLCAATTIFFGVSFSSDRITMDPNTNPNTLGLIMMIGTFSLLYKLNFKKTITTCFIFLSVFLFVYVIILTGSRKSLLGVAILLLLWFLFVLKDTFKKGFIIKNLVVFLIIFAVGIYLVNSFVLDASVFIRLENLFQSGDTGRVSMYLAAFELFKDAPFLGIGINNFREISVFGTYSHSTYAEILASTGIIGTVIYFIPYISQIGKTLRMIKHPNNEIASKAKLMGIVFIVIIFLGTGIIHFYDLFIFLLFGMIISFNAINNR